MAEIKITVRGAESVPLISLEPFQGELKTLERAQYEKLRNVIIKMGFSFVVHVWRHQGKNYIIDGHQRIRAVKTMVEKEGFACPSIPISLVEAKDFSEAKRKILAGASQYGKVKGRGLHQFLSENDIPFDDIAADFDFPEIDFADFTEEFYPQDSDSKDVSSLLPPPPSGDMKVSSDGVRQVQLFFDSDTHKEFLSKAGDLALVYKKENITDILMESLREIHKIRISATK